jgi:diguanylate cyclase (GGDEF)-like protein
VAYRLGLFIVRPLDRLIRGATEVAGGDLAVDLPEAGGAEVGALTRVFNHMVAELREQRQKLEQLTITDSLTGLWNRRHLMERLDTEVARAERQNHPLAAIMLDVDHFKAYNDTHGHMAGDEVLARVAGVLRESVRKVDCAARYGGEEFMVLLPDTSAAAAAEVAERIRERVGLPSRLGRRVTVSIGVAEYPLHGDSPAALVASADAALYQAKAAGRNRVVTQNGTGG